ncbi:MAG TPA: hypothetical protein ENK05_12470 [Gammaproteobacteria bacterium]|nr:hypothetical protein [Gammaproteobacteria bacterium]
MSAWRLGATALAALFLGFVAWWMASEDWETYEYDRDRVSLTRDGTGAPAQDLLPLQEVIRRLQLPAGTRILEVEKERHGQRLLYEIELLGRDGRVYERLVDARTGEVLEPEKE